MLEPPESEGTVHKVIKLLQKALSSAGYVFALAVLPDAKNDPT